MLYVHAVKTNEQGDVGTDCADDRADIFIIIDDDGIEVMRCSTRALAERWIALPQSERW